MSEIKNKWENKGTLKDLLTVKEYDFLEEVCCDKDLPQKADKKIIDRLEEVKKDCQGGLNLANSMLSKLKEGE